MSRSKTDTVLKSNIIQSKIKVSSVDFYHYAHREKLESRDLLVLVVSVDLLDQQDPLVWLEPLASLDERYDPSRLQAFKQLL